MGLTLWKHRVFHCPKKSSVLYLFSPCCCSVAKLSPTVCDPMNFSTPGFPVLNYLPEFAQTHVCWISDTLQPSHPLLPPSPLALSKSLFQWVSISGQSIGASASASVSSNEYSGLISFKIDWFDLLAVQGILKSLLQHHSMNKHQFFGTQHSLWSNSHICRWLLEKTTALTIQTFINKVMSMPFNRLFRFVIAFLPRSKHLSISWLHSPSAVILEPKKMKSVTVSTFPSSICYEVMGPDAMILVFWMLSFRPDFSLSSFTLNQEAL